MSKLCLELHRKIKKTAKYTQKQNKFQDIVKKNKVILDKLPSSY